MQFLYLDDSGSPGNPNEDYVVLGGVCVPEASVHWLSSELENLAKRFDNAHPELVEFHAAEIFRGKNYPWNNFKNKKERIEIITQVLCVLENAFAEIVTFACAVHKPSFPREDPMLTAFEEISSRFNIYLEKDLSDEEHKERGIIIIDKTSYESGLQTLTSTIKKTGNRWGYQLRSIVEVPLFIDSNASRITQLADHIAYAVFRRYNANDITYFNCIENRFQQKDNIIHGLVHRQLHIKNCTCPACITRR